jgi:hypothetical protein
MYLPHSALLFDFFGQFLIFAVITFQVAVLISLILFHCLSRLHSDWLFRGHSLGFLRIRLFTITGCPPVPKLPTWRASQQWSSYIPRFRVVPTVIAFYNLQEPQWDFFLPAHHTGEFCVLVYVTL